MENTTTDESSIPSSKPVNNNSHNNIPVAKKKEESCIGCEYEDYLYALGGDESEDDSYEEYYGRKSIGNRLGLKIPDNNKKLDGRCNSLTLHDPLNSSTSSSSSSNAGVRSQRANSCGNVSLSKLASASPTGSAASPSTKIMNSITKCVQQPMLPFHLSPPCGSALPGTMFHLRFVGSLEVEEEAGLGKKRRKRPKKTMVEEAVTKLKVRFISVQVFYTDCNNKFKCIWPQCLLLCILVQLLFLYVNFGLFIINCLDAIDAF